MNDRLSFYLFWLPIFKIINTLHYWVDKLLEIERRNKENEERKKTNK